MEVAIGGRSGCGADDGAVWGLWRLLAWWLLPGQVDDKFILARAGRHILCFDQHAVDERVRLEQLEKSIPDPLDSLQVPEGGPGRATRGGKLVTKRVSVALADKLSRHTTVRSLP